jgi:hypothetical protein
MPSLVDSVLAYQFIKRFVKPYEEWPAFKAGIIDKDGNIIKKRDELSSDDQKIFGNYDRIILNLRKILAKIPGGKSRLGLWAATALLLKEGDTLDGDNVDLLKERLEHQLTLVEGIQMNEGFRIIGAHTGVPEGTGVPHHVDAWHQSRQNGWCVQVLDKHGNQVGDAEYHYHKSDAMRAKKQLTAHHKLNEDMGAVAVNAVGPGHIAGTKEAGDDPPVSKKAAKNYARKNKKFSDMAFARRKGANNG